MANGGELSAEEIAAIAAGVALVPAAASAYWAGRQSRSAGRSADAAETQATEAKNQVAAAKEQAVAAEKQAESAKEAVETARDQLVTAQESVKIAADQLGSSRGVALGQLLLTIDELLLVHYDDIHGRLHPRSPKEPWSENSPPAPEEQVSIETYMGLFERILILIQREIIPIELARRFYRYRVVNLVRNEWVRKKKLHEQADGWSDFLELCDELEVDVPA